MAYIHKKGGGAKRAKGLPLLCISILLSVVTANAQEQKVVLPKQTLSTKEVVREVSNQTDYNFAINHTQFDDYRVIYFPKMTLTLREVLNQLITGTNLTYLIKHRQILILALDDDNRKVQEQEKAPVKTPDKVLTPRVTKTPPVTPVATPDYNFEQEVARHAALITQDEAKEIPKEAPKEIIKEIPEGTFTSFTAHYSGQESALVYTTNEIGHLYLTQQRSLPAIGAKVNLLYGAVALAPNIALEVGLSRRTTLDLSVAFNLWKKDKTYETNKMVHLIAKPEFRYWLCERFNGHFFGVHPFYWDYNVSGKDIPLLFDKEYRYEGNAFGAGISYGYHWMWGKRWGMEFNVGAGASFMKYKKFEAVECGEKLGDFRKKYFGPTSAGIKIMYLIK